MATERERVTEIDGLRALAVGLVVIFHFTTNRTGGRLPGGALGVDVFFVISGFVITRLLVSQLLDKDGLSFRQFYGRRVVRLIPASLLVVAVTGVAALTLNIADRSLVIDDIVPALFGFANWHLISLGSDYWAPHAAATPLDHYWSLAVEDQFYLVWPSFVFLAWAAARRLGNRMVVLTVVTGALAAAALFAWHAAPTDGAATYFATQYRMGELLLGGFVALVALQLRKPLPRWVPAAGCGVLALVVARVALVHVSTDIAKWGTIISLATAAAVLALGGAEERPWCGLLRWKPVVYIGTISYGIYLWHFPVDQLLPRPDNPMPVRVMFVVRVALTFALAAASYALLEHPLRVRAADGRIKPNRAFVGALAGVVAVALFSTIAINTSLSRGRGVIDGREMVAASRDHPSQKCRRLEGAFCSRAGDGGGPILAVFGDSHVMQWDPAWKAITQDHDAEYLFSRGPCAIGPGLQLGKPVGCPDAWKLWIQGLADLERPTVAVITFHVSPDADIAAPASAAYASTESSLNTIVDALEAADIPTILLTPIPEFPTDVPRCLALRRTAAACTVKTADVDTAGRAALTRIMNAAVASHKRVAAVHVDELACPGGVCRPIDRGVVTRSDNDHLSVTYARVLTSKLEAAIEDHCGAGLGGSWLCP